MLGTFTFYVRGVFRVILFGVVGVVMTSISAFAFTIGDDGLHKQEWFALTFRDISEDMATAAEMDKRLVLVIEQRGCIYCEKMHEEVLEDSEVSSYLRDNYMIVQYNLYGDEEVIDLDGEVLTEKTASRKWAIAFTPTIIFMPELGGFSEGEDVREASVITMPGAFLKGTFLDLFTWVRELGYEGDEDFQRFHARRIQERRELGIPNTD